MTARRATLLRLLRDGPMSSWAALRAWQGMDRNIAEGKARGGPGWYGVGPEPPACPGIDAVERELRWLASAGYLYRSGGHRRTSAGRYGRAWAYSLTRQGFDVAREAW